MNNIEIANIRAAAEARCKFSWAAWVRVRDAGQADLRSPEFQEHNAAQQALSAAMGLVSDARQSRIEAGYRAIEQGRRQTRDDRGITDINH